jgi:hypothetical protein
VESKDLESVADQMMDHAAVTVASKKFPVKRIGHNRLRTVTFQIGSHEYQAIEQNPEKPSRWGKLARDGHRVVQFRDVLSNKYVAVCIDGKLKEYSRLRKPRKNS